MVGVLLAGAAPPGERAPRPRELRHRTLTFDDREDALPEVHVAGGATTLLTFPGPVVDGGAVLADPRGLFYPPTQTDRTVIVAPRADLAAPVALHVSLVDGTVLTFQLASVAGESDAQVDVALAFRARAPADSAPALRRALEACRAEADESRSGAGQLGSRALAALLVGDPDGRRPFDRRPLRGGDRQDGMLVDGSFAYRMGGLTFLLFHVENRDPARPWTFERAEARVEGAGEVADLRVIAGVAEPPTLGPGEVGRVAVAFPGAPRAPGQRLTVTLREKDGGRHVVLDGLSP